MAGARQYGYQFETSPRKLEPEYKKTNNPYKKKKSAIVENNNTKKKTTTNTKKKSKYNVKPIIYIAVGFIMLFTISYRNSLINESYNEKEKLKSELSSIQKENEQLKVNIESSLNLNSVERTAQEELGMQKLNNSQKVYVNLQKKDYVEPTTEKVVINENTSWWSRVLNALMQKIK